MQATAFAGCPQFGFVMFRHGQIQVMLPWQECFKNSATSGPATFQVLAANENADLCGHVVPWFECTPPALAANENTAENSKKATARLETNPEASKHGVLWDHKCHMPTKLVHP